MRNCLSVHSLHPSLDRLFLSSANISARSISPTIPDARACFLLVGKAPFNTLAFQSSDLLAYWGNYLTQNTIFFSPGIVSRLLSAVCRRSELTAPRGMAELLYFRSKTLKRLLAKKHARRGRTLVIQNKNNI